MGAMGDVPLPVAMSLAGSCAAPAVGAAPAVSLEGVGVETEPVLEWSVHQRVFPDLKHILPHCPDFGALRIVQTWQPTRHDMISWKSMVEHERDEKTGRFVAWAQQVCEEVRRAGYWADFVDPATGLAHNGQNNIVFVATEVGIQRLGFPVLDTGCCQVLIHAVWGAKSFPATLFCTAPEDVLERCIAAAN